MLKLLGLGFKLAIFAVIVLVMGQLLHWNGRTISDQVRLTISSAERSPSVKKLKTGSEDLMNDARQALKETSNSTASKTRSAAAKSEKASPGEGSPVSEGIPHEAREELNALLGN